jgi:hypothetical protein
MTKLFTVIVALGLAVSFAAPTFAATPTTKKACEAAHMKWDAAAKKCS